MVCGEKGAQRGLEMAVANKEHECWISEQDSIISFKAVADYVHHCFDTRDELMDYILDALSRISYRVQ